MTELRLFLETFVLPLVAGGDVHVGAPVAPETLARWETELGDVAEALGYVDEARAASAVTLVVRAPAMSFDAQALRLAAALYSALVLAHPGVGGWLNRKGRRELAAFALELTQAPPPETTVDLLARHTLLGRLFELVRVDTHVKWWTGRAEFLGEPPPRRLLRWRKLRRVKEETAEVALTDVLAADETRAVIGGLLTASPLSDLLSADAPGRRWPPFRWGVQLEVLRDEELARAVGYHWTSELAREGGAPRLRACAAAASAWEQCLATPLELLPRSRASVTGVGEAVVRIAPLLSLPARAAPPLSPADMRAATAFLVYLNALCALAETDEADLDAPSALVGASLAARRGPELAQPEASGLRLFFCVPDVAARCDPALAGPAGVSGDARLARRWNAHRAQVRAALGEERLAQLARRLAACL